MDPRPPSTPQQPTTPERLEQAFRTLHGRRLHGFALLLTLGERDRAARLAADALAEGAARADALRHPERAAAWLRAHVTRRADASRSPEQGVPVSLASLGADPAVLAGLAAVDTRSRAAIIAGTIEGLDQRDVGTIVGRDGRALARLVETGLRRYAAAHAAASPDAGAHATEGSIVARVHAAARRAIA